MLIEFLKTFEIYYENTFNNLVEKSLCWKIADSVKRLFLIKKLGNKKIFNFYYDRIIKGVKDSELYKDLDDYESTHNKIN